MSKKTGMEGTYTIDWELRKLDKIMAQINDANIENKHNFYELKKEVVRLKERNSELTKVLNRIKFTAVEHMHGLVAEFLVEIIEEAFAEGVTNE